MSKSNKHQTYSSKKFAHSTTGKYQNNEKKKIVTAQHENIWEKYQTRHAIPNTQREKYFEHNINPNSNKNIQEKENEIEKAKPIPFLDDLDKK